MTEQHANFKTVDLGGGPTFLIGQLPEPLLPTATFLTLLTTAFLKHLLLARYVQSIVV